MTTPVICVDGPSGAGKGTLSQQLAETLGWHLLDSGALYRVVGHACVLSGVDWQDETAVTEVARSLDVVFQAQGDGVGVLLGGEDVSRAIRSEQGSLGASAVALLPRVRGALLERQREMAAPPGLVADGRDMGTVVFPNAPLKIFLTASAEARAERRRAQLLARGEDVSLPRLLATITERDARDSTRSVSPLLPADDAVVIDSSSLSVQAVMERVMECVVDRGLKSQGPS